LICSGSLSISGFFVATGSIAVSSGGTVKLSGGALVQASALVSTSSTLIVNGMLNVTEDMTVFGLVTHDLTNSASSGVLLTVTGTMYIPSGGAINVDQKSSYYQTGSSRYQGAYGGSSISTANQGYTSNMGGTAYGSFQNPNDLGCAYYYYYTSYAGGRVRIIAGSMDVNGTISARGIGAASGGSINIALTTGAIIGSGVLDVSSVSSGTSSYDCGSGGRLAITGFTVMSNEIFANIKMNGAHVSYGGTGTFFLRALTCYTVPFWSDLLI
jgi:hypothetical protein